MRNGDVRIDREPARINISVYFAIIVACILVIDNTGIAFYALLAAGLHEVGHLITLKVMRAEIEEISFKAFGVNIKLRSTVSLDYKQEIIVSLAGPLANLIVAAIAYLLSFIGFHSEQFLAICAINIIVAVFNLLPVTPLDGGRALECLMLSRYAYLSVQRIMVVISIIFILPLACVGFYMVMKTGYNITLIVAAIYLAGIVMFKGRLITKIVQHT
jgi:stage IV sporulation protein FB